MLLNEFSEFCGFLFRDEFSLVLMGIFRALILLENNVLLSSFYGIP